MVTYRGFRQTPRLGLVASESNKRRSEKLLLFPLGLNTHRQHLPAGQTRTPRRQDSTLSEGDQPLFPQHH